MMVNLDHHLLQTRLLKPNLPKWATLAQTPSSKGTLLCAPVGIKLVTFVLLAQRFNQLS